MQHFSILVVRRLCLQSYFFRKSGWTVSDFTTLRGLFAPSGPWAERDEGLKLYRYLNCFVKTQVFETVVPLIEYSILSQLCNCHQPTNNSLYLCIKFTYWQRKYCNYQQKCNFYFCLLCLVCTFERLVSDEITVDLLWSLCIRKIFIYILETMIFNEEPIEILENVLDN